jgi:exodeoxyribonuclease VII large subunit
MNDILTVSQLNDDIKAFLEEAFGMIWVEGEVSNLRRPQSGHTYFTLKDEKSQIRAVYFRQHGYVRNRAAGFDLEDGMRIICRARLSAYPPRGEYQLIIESVEPQGVGALQKAFEQLKARLAAEGLFDTTRRKELPYLPRCVGVITSTTGAVIKDILNVTRRRFPSVNILIAPARVQGKEAAGEIIAALHNLQTCGKVDVIIIARGGGSLEDLMPFNDEALARAIFHSSIPIVSAVGHETDFTICDFVADLRAPTPSAAAELVLPLQAELQDRLQTFRQRLISAERRFIVGQKDNLSQLKMRFKDPRRFLIDFTIHLDDLRERIRRAALQNSRLASSRLRQLELGLQSRNPERMIRERRIMLENLEKNIIAGWRQCLSRAREKLDKNAALLDSLSPLGVLQRGYSITRRLSNGEIIRQASRLTLGERIAIQLDQGNLAARVEKIHGE